MADSTPTKSYSSDPTLWLYTSLSSGSSHIVTATSRLETILKANRIPFKALDVATDEKARMLWGRRAGKRKLPGLVKMGMVVGDIDEIEEWNEYGELKEQLGAEMTQLPAPATSTSKPTPSKTPIPAAPDMPTFQEASAAAAKTSTDTQTTTKSATAISFAPQKPKSEMSKSTPVGAGGAQASMSMTMRQLGQEAAARAKQNKSYSLAARKAQVAAAEKADDSESPQVLPLASNTETVPNMTPETVKSDVSANAEPSSLAKDESHSEDTTASTDVKDRKSVDPAPTNPAETSATSGPIAAKPENPLPIPGEDQANGEERSSPIVPKLQKSESAVSNSSIPVSIDDLQGPHNEIVVHRGSSISTASKAEIKAVENAWKIPEEPEEIDESIPIDASKSETKMTGTQQDTEQEVQSAGNGKEQEIDERQAAASADLRRGLESKSEAEDLPTVQEQGASTKDEEADKNVAKKCQGSVAESRSAADALAADPEVATESVKD